MSFENEERYRRKPDPVHAARLTAEGNISLYNADDAWLKRLRESGQLAWGGSNFFVGAGTAHVAAAYGGDWIVAWDGTDAVEVMSDVRFRSMFDVYDAELEEEDA